MHLLAFDTSTDRLSIAVCRGARQWQHEADGGAKASATLIPAIQSLLADAGLQLAQLDAVVFGRGPGSFTGLRTACAVAQGLAWGAGVPVLGIDTLLAVAEEARGNFGCARVVALLDARMDEVYAAHWAWHDPAADGATHGATAGWQCEAASGLQAPEDVDVPPGWVIAGNAVAAYGERLAPHAAPGTARHLALPTALALLRLAPARLAAGEATAAARAMPLYVRDKVARTTDERVADKAARDAAAAAAPVGTPAAKPTDAPRVESA